MPIATRYFTVTAPQGLSTIKLDSKGVATCQITVKNVSRTAIDGRGVLTSLPITRPPAGAVEKGWVKIEGPADRHFAVDQEEVFSIKIAVPQPKRGETPPPAGNYGFRLDVVNILRPDDSADQSQALGFAVAVYVPPPPSRLPLILGVVAAVLIIGVVATWLLLRNPGLALAALPNGAPVVGHNLDGRLELFVVGKDGRLWHRVQSVPNGSFDSWHTVTTGNPRVSALPRIGYNQDGRMEVYDMQSGGVLWHVTQTAPNGSWDSGSTLGAPPGGIIGGVTVANNRDGRLEVFGVGSDHQVYHAWQTAANGPWSSWGSMGAPGPGVSTGDPRVIRNADGRLQVFLVASDQKIWTMNQMQPNLTWSSWYSLGGPPAAIANGAPFLGNNGDGRIELFATGADGAIYHIYQTAPNGGWSSWSQLQAPVSAVQFPGFGAVANNKDGRFQVFFIGSDGALWTLPQSVPSGGWGQVLSLKSPGKLRPNQIPASALSANGNLAVFVTGADGNIWQISQTSPGGAWGDPVKQ